VPDNEFDVGLKARKAIYRPFPQSVPAAYVIDMDACINDRILFCDHCVRACEPDAIDFDMLSEEIEIDVGSILVAVGFQEFDARKLGNYGYGRFPNVITSLELERMLNASGVTQGHVVRPSDLKTPKRIVIVQCVGARGEGGRLYCSRFCCMNAVKDSMLIRQHDPEVEEITILYTDLRAFGKGFDDFVARSLKEQSATYVRGRPAKIDLVPHDETLELFVEDTVKLQATIGEVEQAECSNCGLCASVCPFQAIQWEKKEPAQLVKALCAGCGTCAAACPTGAITMRHFTDDQLLAQVHAMLEEHPRDKVVVFACNWCSYAGADMAGISRLQYPPTGHLIRTMCSGRVSEEMVLEAFRCGAPVVLVSGCHYADCHYIDANRQTVKRVQKLWNKLERASVRPERLQLEWISAAEGQKFAEVMGRMETLRTTVTEGEVAHAKEALKPKPKKIPLDRASKDGRSTNST
jgi:coenzyme F420-reducing hydrogenase delta subunit/NAD-dependent dihydropyrimidine dehydrogenase PreA subunit